MSIINNVDDNETVTGNKLRPIFEQIINEDDLSHSNLTITNVATVYG